MSELLDRVHRFLSRRAMAVELAVKLRNQCDAIVRARLGPSCRLNANGERDLLKQLASDCMTIVDVGANDGDYATTLLELCEHVPYIVCMEPNPHLAMNLRSKFAGIPNVRVIEVAAGDNAGEAIFFTTSQSSQLGSLVRPESAESEVLVKTVRLDDELEQLDISYIDLLKIDVEGFDFRVLQGAKRLLDRKQVGVIQFEYNSQWAYDGATLLAALQFLNERGYESGRLLPGRIEPVNYHQWGEYFGYSNYVSVLQGIERTDCGFPLKTRV